MIVILVEPRATHLEAGHMIMALNIEASYKYCSQS